MSRHDSIDYRDKICPVCEVRFTPRTGRQIYCSTACRLGRSICHGCGKRFVKTKNTTGKYCSTACWYKAPGKKEIAAKQCEICGKEFQPSERKVRFCSRECSRENQRSPDRNKNCEKCGTPLRPDVGIKTRFCSMRCAHLGRPSVFGYADGTRRTVTGGYIDIKVNGQWVREHRWMMEQKIGRPVKADEVVHHVNGQRDDNRPENLELWFRQHPSGQRVDDLLDFVVAHYRAELLERLKE
jgi:hypothetical protein